jgi:O-Antigen ligase
LQSSEPNSSSFQALSQKISLAGLLLYVVFAPHSVAASSIAVALAVIGWLLLSLARRSFGLQRTPFDLIIWLSLFWTGLSAVFSTEPGISIPKLQASWCVLLFYLTRAVLTKRSALLLVCILIVSASSGVLYSVFDVVRGRGVVVESISPVSPFKQIEIQPGDTIWRINRKRVYSITEIDSTLRGNKNVSVSIISRGEHVEKPGVAISAEAQHQTSPSGLTGSVRSHQFRASGWTRHYETFAEILQIVVQLALGLALAHLRNHGPNKYFKLALLATGFLTIGIALTAMRTVLIAFVIGATVVAFRSLRGAPKVVFTAALLLVLGFGAMVVWRARDQNALLLGDPSSSLRAEVARVGLSRIWIHPILGHGMDAMKLHWNEWGFPGKDMVHLHSTPLQLAFDRGLPMLALWLWMMIAFWLYLWRSVSQSNELSDTNTFGLLLGALGGLTGFLASSLVNYNYGDTEVNMLFWFVMGMSVAIAQTPTKSWP